MALTNNQAQALATALRASSDPVVVAALAIRDDVSLTNWCNSATATLAWHEECGARDLFEATDVTKFDNLTAGKRAAWDLLLRFAPLDFGKAANRKAALDVWGASDSVSVLQSCRRAATNAELIFGGTDQTTNIVAAKKLTRPGSVAIFDVSDALNRF